MSRKNTKLLADRSIVIYRIAGIYSYIKTILVAEKLIDP